VARVVLDASALLALLNDEPGARVVEEALPEALLSAVNLAEVASILVGGGMEESGVRNLLLDLGLTVVVFDEAAAFGTAALRPATKALGLSLGDRACLALARAEGVPALTADRAWTKAEVGVKVELIR